MAIQAEAPKSTPDISKLSGMTARVVQVTRHTSKTGPGQLVLAPWKNVTVDQVNELLTVLPKTNGPGIYRFEVYDEGGPEKDVWTVKLGGDVPEYSPPANVLPFTNGAGHAHNMNSSMGNVLPEGLVEIGHGYYYNATLGLLTTPQKQLVQWSPGSPLPGQVGPVSAPIPTATPWGAGPSGPGFSPWGSMPAVDDNRVNALQEQLRAERESREAAERRREMDNLQNSFAKAIESTNSRFEALLSKIAEGNNSAPKGPSSEMLALQARLDQAERAAEQARRDADTQRRDEEMRREMAAMAERTERLIRESSGNKQDPIMAVFGQIITGQQHSSAQMAQAMKETAEIQAEGARETSRLMSDRLGGSVLTPDKMVELIRLAKDRGPEAEASKGLSEMYKTVFGMAQDLIRAQADINGSASGPAWLPMAQQGVEQLGRIAQSYAVTKAQAEAQQTQQRRAAPLQQRSVAGNPPRRSVATALPTAHAPAALPPEQAEDEPTASEIRDAAAAGMFKKNPNSASAIRDRAAASTSMYGGPVVVDEEETPAPAPAPRQKRKAAPVQAPQAPAPQAIPMPAVQRPAPMQTQQVVTPDEIVNSMGVSAADANAQFAAASSDVVREIVRELSDEDFFGEALSQVQTLRLAVQNDSLPVAEAANAVLTSRQYFQSFGVFPPCIELLQAGHIDVLVERLLPDAPLEYLEELVEVLRGHLESESS